MHELVSYWYLFHVNNCFHCQQDFLQPGQAVWSWMGVRFSLYSVKFISLQRGRDEVWNQCVLTKLCRIWPKAWSDSSGLWTKAFVEGFLENSPSTRTLNILLLSIWCLLIWIFFSNHVPSLKAEHCNTQQLKANIEESFSIIYTMIQSEHM